MHNVTNKVPGYDLGYGHEYVLDALQAIVAQEQLHQLNANNALKRFGKEPIQPCKYSFPVTDFHSAINLAATFTNVVLGVLQDVNQIFAENGDAGLTRGTSGSLGNEGEQEGFFRLVQKKRPSAQPFLTTATRDFAFTATQSFTIPGSCPNISSIKLKTFKALVVESKDIKPATQALKFSVAKADLGNAKLEDMRLVFITGQNLPITKKLDNIQTSGDRFTFEAGFPFDEFVMNGLTIAAVTAGKTEFGSANEVSDAAVFGPGLFEVE